MILIFSDEAWEDYLYWQQHDKKILKKINKLIKEIQESHLKVLENLSLLNIIGLDIGREELQ